MIFFNEFSYSYVLNLFKTFFDSVILINNNVSLYYISILIILLSFLLFSVTIIKLSLTHYSKKKKILDSLVAGGSIAGIYIGRKEILMDIGLIGGDKSGKKDGAPNTGSGGSNSGSVNNNPSNNKIKIKKILLFNKIKTLIKSIKPNFSNSNYIYSLFPFLNLDSILTPISNLSGFYKMVYGILMLSILLLISIVQVAMYFLILYLITNYNLVEKYPKYNKIILYFKNMNVIYIIIELIFVVVTLLTLIVICIKLLYFT